MYFIIILFIFLSFNYIHTTWLEDNWRFKRMIGLVNFNQRRVFESLTIIN